MYNLLLDGSAASLTLRNSILANTAGGNDLVNDGGTVAGGSNLVRSQTGVPSGVISLTSDPRLGPLQPNGGPTPTMALAADSPAANAGDNSLLPAGLTTDQRGTGFPRILNTTVDLGAFELNNSAPTGLALSNASVAENRPSGTAVGTLSTTDPDAGNTFTYTLVGGAGSADNASFAIVGGQLTTAAAFDFEARSSYSIRVRTTDQGGLSFERSFTITVTDVNEAPTGLALSNASVAENRPSGTAVGTLSTTDPDAGNTFTYTLVGGAGAADNASFAIVGGQLTTAAAFDFEAKSSYAIRVRATDQGGLSFERSFTITVTDVNEAPTATVPGPLTAFEDVDQALTGVVVGDPEGDALTVTLGVTNGTLTLGSTAGLTVSGNGSATVTASGAIADLNAALATLIYRGVLNFAGGDTLSVDVSDGALGLSPTATVAITVRSASEQAADLQAQIAALAAMGVLNGGQANALTVKLDLKGNAGDADKVRSFLSQVTDFREAGILTAAQAESLLARGNVLLLGVTRR